MSKQSKNSKPEFGYLTDKTVIPEGEKSTRILEIGITAPALAGGAEKPSLNLSVVIDRSGSMRGEKMHFAKQAAAHLADLLSAKDRMGVVMYDSEIDVVAPSLEMTEENRSAVKNAIQQIASRGSTNLFEGWLRGCALVAEQQGEKNFSRTLLLSDGLANQGITGQDQIATEVRALSQRGVSTSCFGIGRDYNEDLLEAMANAGGGNFHFLEAMEGIPIAFEREFEDLIHISLQDVTVEIELPEGTDCAVSGGWPGTRTGNIFKIELGTLFAERAQKIYLQLHLPALTGKKEITLPIKLQAKNAEGKGVTMEEEVTLAIIDAEKAKQTEPDKELMERFAMVDMADKASEALRMARKGDRRGSSERIRSSMRRHEEHMSEEMRRKYGHMSRTFADGMDAVTMKRHHQEAYHHKRVQKDVREYRLELVNGHMLTRIENRRVLIDTGIPVSIGAGGEFYFMHKVHTLSEGYLGVTTGQISQLVGAPVDLIMGSEILNKYVVLFDLRRGVVSFSTVPLMRGGQSFPLSLLMGVPGMGVDAGGRSRQMYVDTGAKLSYLSAEMAKGLTPTGTEEDFYPGMGRFETQVYEVEFSLGDLTFTLLCGVLPGMLETAMKVSGKEGIIGAGLFAQFTVELDAKGKQISLRA